MGGGGDRAEVGKKRIDCDTEPHDTERLVHQAKNFSVSSNKKSNFNLFRPRVL
jgi:hypothetical protein